MERSGKEQRRSREVIRRTSREANPTRTVPFLGPEKAAEYIGVSIDIMYEMLRDRKIPYVPKGKNGQQYTIDRCDLDIWIEKNKISAAA